jgi:hypothetical protein
MFKGTTWRLLAVVSAAVVMLVLAVVATAAGGPVHKVSVGVADFCDVPTTAQNPGCNANFSIEAQQLADGSARGNYTDQFGHGNGGFHAQVDCLYIQGNKAWVSGIITSGTYNVGSRVLTEVVDNGTSAKDPPDTISYSYAPYALTVNCKTFHPNLIQVAVPKGQVKVS